MNRYQIENFPFHTPSTFYSWINDQFPDLPFLRCALDCAYHDLYGNIIGKHSRAILHIPDNQQPPMSSFTIGMGSQEEVLDKIKCKPWPIYKIKLGGPQDMDIMNKIRQTTDAVLRVDANEGWTYENIATNCRILADLQVEFVEQPLPAKDDHLLASILGECPLPLIADEACQEVEDVQKCHGRYHAINIKLMKCGGITPAFQMIQEARELGLKIMIGCMTESSIGISSAAQLAPLVDYVDLDGALLLKKDVAVGIILENGKIKYPSRNGHGGRLLETIQ